MDYFSKFLRTAPQSAPKQVYDHAAEFHKSWTYIKETLTHPDERQLSKGIKATDVPSRLKSMVDSLVWESTRADGVAGACMEYLLKNDVLGNLVQLSEADRPAGVQAEVLRAVQSMVVLLDEQFLVHSAVHKAILRLLRTCVGENLQEQLDGRSRILGAAGTSQRAAPSEYEEDLVDLLCILCSRIRTFRELLMIFFHDKHVFHSDSHASGLVGLDDDSDEDDIPAQHNGMPTPTIRAPSPTPSEDTISSEPEPSQKKPEYEFILFNYLLRFVHREGKIGEFARAGLLFLLDVAMSPGVPVNRLAEAESGTHHEALAPPMKEDPVTDAALSLAEYILDGDFSEVLSAGLGAVYSLLPSKLQVKPAAQKNVLQPGTYDALDPDEEKDKSVTAEEDLKARGIQESSNPSVQAQLDHFLRLVDFLEDVLRRNSPRDAEDEGAVGPSSLLGSAIVQSILSAVRKGFFENVLYPSILECSSMDGSAVAVLSYVQVLLVSLREGRLVETLLDFLMSEDDPEPARRQRQPTLSLQPESKAERLKRQKSSAMLLLEMEAPDTGKITEYVTNIGRFTLKDLLSANLASKSQPSATAALQLLSSLFTHHCEIVVDKLLISHREMAHQQPLFTPGGLDALDEEDEFVYPGAEGRSPTAAKLGMDSTELPVPPTTILVHEREMDMYHMLVSRIDPTHESLFSTSYEHYLRDAVMDIQQHPHCGLESYLFEDELVKYRLDPNDRIFTQILQSLRSFFSNTPQLNMALTGALATLACCPSRSLEGWLTYSHTDVPPTPAYELPVRMKEKDLDDDASIDCPTGLALDSLHSMPTLPTESSQPVVYLIFQGLVSQLSRFQDAVPQFDTYLSERRRGLLFSENLSDALSLSLEMLNTMSPPPSTASSSTLTVNSPPANPKVKPTSSWTSFLSSKKTRSNSKSSATAPNANDAGTRGDKGGKASDASPFGIHYQRTRAINIEVVEAPMPFSPLWRGKAQKLDFEDEESYGGWGGSEFSKDDRESSHAGADGQDKRRVVPLSQVLDNVVILEEAIKELASLIHARRCLGIDALRYL